MLAIGVAFPVHAQNAVVADSTDPDAIIITARKQPERLSHSGVPVSILPGKEIVETGTTTADRLNERFPALTVEPTATGNLIFIRGVGNFTLQPNSDPAVAFAYDGVFISRPMGTISQFFDLDRIELLKGPQGVLYGRNASAGSINLEPRQPVLGQRSVSAHASFASVGQFYSEAALNLPVAKGTAFRLSGAGSAEDSLLKGYRTGPRQQSVRAQIKSQIAPSVTIRLSADYNHVGGVGIGTSYAGKYLLDPTTGTYSFVDSNLSRSFGIYSAEGQAFRQTIFLPSAGRNLDPIASQPRQNHRFYGVHARIDADLGFGRLTLIPAWRKGDLRAIVSGSPFGYGQFERNEQSSIETRLVGSRGPVDWLIGSFLFDERINSDTMTNLSSALIQASQDYRTKSGAVFGNMTAHVTDRVRVSAGARWTSDRKNYDSQSTTLAIVCQRRLNGRPSCPTVPLFPLVGDLSELPFLIPARLGPPVPIIVNGLSTGALVARSEIGGSGRLTDRSLTWRIGSEVDLGPRSLLYASVETGRRPGGFNTAVGFETYGPERITAYTLGLRHRSPSERFQVDLEAFWWNYRDQQVSALRPDLSSPPRNANITENIGSSRIRGLEADVRLRPLPRTDVRAVVQFLDADYRSFRYLYANAGAPPLTGCATSLSQLTNLYTVDCSDKQPYNSPHLNMNLSARQSISLGEATMTVRTDNVFKSGRNIGFAFLPEQHIGPTWTSDVQVMVTWPKHHVEVSGFIRNIGGRRVSEFMIYHPVSNALVVGTSPPRQIGFRASVDLQ